MSHKNKEFGISSWAVDNRVTVYILTLLIVITGVIAYVTMPREDFPEIIENKVYISSVFPGNSAEDVEKLIIKPLEKEIKNISGVEKITSNSFQDYGMIIVEFADNITIEDAKTKIKDKVDVKKADSDWPNLDNGSKVEPNVFELNISEEVPILNINLKGNYTTQQLKKYGELLQDDIEEIKEVKTILKDESYQQLMKAGSGNDGAAIYFVGIDDEHIEEFVVLAGKKENGFAVVRVLGNDMNPTNIMNMLTLLQKANVDLEQLKPLQQLMK